MFYDFLKSDLGVLYLEATEQGIARITIIDEVDIHTARSNSLLAQTKTQLEEYFSGARTIFNLSLDLGRGTPFQQKVWQILEKIPYGQTTNYLSIAKKLGNPKAVRAVGTANGQNPIPIIIPCHRVIGSDGSLVGYALGLDIKKKLLALENPNSFGCQQRLFD